VYEASYKQVSAAEAQRREQSIPALSKDLRQANVSTSHPDSPEQEAGWLASLALIEDVDSSLETG
jgi:hypothetical protein